MIIDLLRCLSCQQTKWDRLRDCPFSVVILNGNSEVQTWFFPRTCQIMRWNCFWYIFNRSSMHSYKHHNENCFYDFRMIIFMIKFHYHQHVWCTPFGTESYIYIYIYIYIVPSGVKMGHLYFYTSNRYALRFTHISTLIDIVTDSGGVILTTDWCCTKNTSSMCQMRGGWRASFIQQSQVVPSSCHCFHYENYLTKHSYLILLHSWLYSVHDHKMLLLMLNSSHMPPSLPPPSPPPLPYCPPKKKNNNNKRNISTLAVLSCSTYGTLI